jgi:cysteine synthase B
VQGLRSLADGYTPPILDVSRLDGKVLVRNRDAVAATRALAEREGIFAGVSCGAVVHTAARVAAQMDAGTIVVLLADGGWKYLSAGLWTRELPELTEDMEDKLWW